MRKNIYLILMSVLLFSVNLVQAEAIGKKSSYSPVDVIVKKGVVFFKADDELFDGRVIIHEAAKPSYIDVQKGLISKLSLFRDTAFSTFYYKNKMKHRADIQGDNKPLDIRYINGVLNKVKLGRSGMKLDASFDESANVVEFKGVYDKNDLIIELKNKVITYTKKSTLKELKVLNIQDEKYNKAYSKMNSMVRKIGSAMPSYKNAVTMLNVPIIKKKVKITLAKCQEILGEKEYTRVKKVFDDETSLSYYCNQQANKKT